MNPLEQWLQRATRGLAAGSKVQVRAEIAEHYYAALSEPGATEATAVESLGDPAQANCEYRKVLLTASEARLLREEQWSGKMYCSRPWVLALFPLAAFAIGMAAFYYGAVWAALVMLAGAALLSGLSFPIYTPSRGAMFRGLRWAWMIALFWVSAGGNAGAWTTAIASFSVVVWMEWTNASLRRKLPIERWPKFLYI